MTVEKLLEQLAQDENNNGKRIRVLTALGRKNCGCWIWNCEETVDYYRITNKYILIYI